MHAARKVKSADVQGLQKHRPLGCSGDEHLKHVANNYEVAQTAEIRCVFTNQTWGE